MTKAQCNGVEVWVGHRVRKTRIFRNRSILDTARHLAVSVLEYAELEEGTRRFKPAQLTELSNLLRVNLAMFFGEPAKFDLKKYYTPNAAVYYSTNDNEARRSSQSE